MPSVLVVDDSPVARRAVAGALSAEGFDVQEIGTAAGARALDASGFACAILDLELGDGDGLALAHELQARCPSLAVAFFTAGASPELVERSRAYGPVFRKPDLDPVVAWTQRASRPPPQPSYR